MPLDRAIAISSSHWSQRAAASVTPKRDCVHPYRIRRLVAPRVQELWKMLSSDSVPFITAAIWRSTWFDGGQRWADR